MGMQYTGAFVGSMVGICGLLAGGSLVDGVGESIKDHEAAIACFDEVRDTYDWLEGTAEFIVVDETERLVIGGLTLACQENVVEAVGTSAWVDEHADDAPEPAGKVPSHTLHPRRNEVVALSEGNRTGLDQAIEDAERDIESDKVRRGWMIEIGLPAVAAVATTAGVITGRAETLRSMVH